MQLGHLQFGFSIGSLFSPPPPPLSLVLTDTWSLEESLVLINSLELRAVFLALKFLEVYVSGQSLLVCSDNATIVSYINFQGGFSLPLSLSFSNRAVGVVFSEGNPSFDRSLSGG